MLLPRTQLKSLVNILNREFSSSACFYGQISHVGRQPLTVPPNVTLTPSPDLITINGPLGSTSIPLRPYIRLKFLEGGILEVSVDSPSLKEQRQMWGLTRTLIYNAVVGMTEGFTVPLYLVGVGYRAAIEADPRGPSDESNGQRLNLKLGFSHSVFIPIPPYIKAEVSGPTTIMLSSTDKQKLGNFAATVRRWRPPEPYKGKGIFVGNERVRIKSVKKK